MTAASRYTVGRSIRFTSRLHWRDIDGRLQEELSIIEAVITATYHDNYRFEYRVTNATTFNAPYWNLRGGSRVDSVGGMTVSYAAREVELMHDANDDTMEDEDYERAYGPHALAQRRHWRAHKDDPLWLKEFGASAGVDPALTSDPDLVDISWHNDIAPSFQLVDDHSDDPPRIWAYPPNIEDREAPDMARYLVITDEQTTLYEGDDVAAAIAALKTTKGTRA